MINFTNKIISTENQPIPTIPLSPISQRISTNLLNDFSNLNFSGVYRIGSATEKRDCYIGSAYNITLKITHHLNLLYRGEHHSKTLQEWVNKNGLENIDISVLIRCKSNPSEFESFEQYFLDIIKPKFNSILNKRKVKVEYKQVNRLNYCNTKHKNQFNNPIVSTFSSKTKRTILKIVSSEIVDENDRKNLKPIYYFNTDGYTGVINNNPSVVKKKVVSVPIVAPVVRKGVFKV